MRRIYSHPNLAMVQLAKNELDNRGIHSVIQGEHLATVIGGGAGFDAWVELWVNDDDRVEEAVSVIQESVESEGAEEGRPWTCSSCGETIEAQFDLCWNCGANRPE